MRSPPTLPPPQNLKPALMCVQYIGGCSVHRRVFSASGDIMSTLGGHHEYIGGIS